MKNSLLIEKLQQFPADMDVNILDVWKNLNSDDGEGSSVGIYEDFGIEKIEPEPDTPAFNDGFKPFIGLVFKNEEYSEEERSCRVCGCTEYNCSQCIERTGEPCHWVEKDLCSACVPINK